MKTKLLISVLIILFSGFKAEAQSKAQARKPVSGIVTVFNKYPLMKVEIVALKTGEIAHTDSIGRFLIECFNRDALYLSASGFKNRKIRIRGENIYLVDLVYEDNITNFYDAVHNGHIAEDVLLYAIINDQKKHGKDYSRYNTIYDLIRSEISNIRVQGTQVLNMKMTGQSSQVLYVVDDIIVPDVSMIAPYTIKTIEFLDGPAESSMYGFDGANGILKIYLK